ncbi:MAG: DUF554 domain-containing protein [Acidaminococcaceae bacterium]|nr:DUF554 domain-containing protein [Acidaminococcaceae bacterium]MBO5606163.1 DUF554 domain-containing protein [Acidaminococcaceae bacterium]MBO6265011.1 DUF554 domain-containing protein [Acidaminococcaceae bacterium]MBP3265061.1 DUF554 domain-containing protein [Acidaminococcaceae bacterium]MBQ5346089.1 DUF554 domain-containing protein [Acidaminococcaceae bacterium]
MTGLGTMVNCAAIIGGCAVGLILRKGFPEKWQETIMYGVALCIFLIGLEMAQKSQNVILVIASIVIGSIIGEMLDINGKLNRFGAWVEKKMLGNRTQTSGSFGKAFISASLVFCIGAMAIVGSIEEGLTGNHQILFAKAMLDCILSIIFGANMGAGVALSAVPVGLYQGSITLLAAWMQNLLTPDVIREVSATGGVLIMAIGIVQARLLPIRLANQIPALPVAILLVKIFM